MSVLSKKNLKNIFFILWYIIYLRMGYFLLTQNGWSDSVFTGALMAIYPLSIFHLESLRTKGEVLWFKGEIFEQLNEPQKNFLLIAGLLSMGVFWLLTFTSVFSILLGIF